MNQGWKNFNFSPGENFQNRWVEYRDGDRRLGPLEFIESISPREQRPPLYFMHLLLPHEPFIYLPSGQIFELANLLKGPTVGKMMNGLSLKLINVI